MNLALREWMEVVRFELAYQLRRRSTWLFFGLLLAMHRIRTGPQTIAITVPGKPVLAGVDPRHLLIDVQPDDNTVVVPAPSSPETAP